MKLPPALRKGDRFRLIPNGPICDKHGKEHRIKVSRGPIEPGISTHSFVYPLEEEKT